jgi:predicted nuclease of predicted toxin-antitoxin system
MKLLFDHHLSRKLAGRLGDQFPGSSHVAFHGLADAEDVDIWALYWNW